MLLPYASDRPPAKLPTVVVSLVLLNFLLFGLFALSIKFHPEGSAIAIYTGLSLVPRAIRPFTPLTYIFLHADMVHLSVNMLFLWVFGAGLEEALGKLRLFVVFIVSGIITGLLQCAASRLLPGGDTITPIVGASGAVSAITGIFAVRFYRSKIKFIGLPIAIPAVLLLVLIFSAEMIATILRIAQSGDGGLGQTAANWAHIGGFVIGMAWAQFAKLHFAGSADYKRADARKAMASGAPLSAVRRLESLLETNPDQHTVRLELAMAWKEAGDTSQGRELFVGTVRSLIETGQKREAVEAYRQMILEFPDISMEPNEIFQVATYLQDTSNHKEALAEYRRILDKHPNCSDAEMSMLRAATILQREDDGKTESEQMLTHFVATFPSSSYRFHAEDMLRTMKSRS